MDVDLSNFESYSAHFDLITKLKLMINLLIFLILFSLLQFAVFSDKQHGLFHLIQWVLEITRVMVVFVHILVQFYSRNLVVGTMIGELHEQLMVTILLLGIIVLAYYHHFWGFGYQFGVFADSKFRFDDISKLKIE